MAKNVFITGATGFLGRNLMKRFIDENHFDRYYVLVRSPSKQRLMEKKFPNTNITYVHGDITQARLGLELEAIDEIKKNTSEIWHLASNTSFNEADRRYIEQVNRWGTGHVLEIAREMDKKSLERIVYVSTAYICGKNSDQILEDEMPDIKVGFKNTYERSKYEAEVFIRGSGLPFTIYRPTILIGNSKTGYSEGETRMMYGYALGLHRSLANLPEFGSEEALKKHWKNDSKKVKINFRLKAIPELSLNLVPVDDCVELMYRILKKDTVNKTFNLVNEYNATVGDVIGAMLNAFKVEGVKYFQDDSNLKLSAAERFANRSLSMFHPYILNKEPSWYLNNTYQETNWSFKPTKITPEKINWFIERYAKREM